MIKFRLLLFFCCLTISAFSQKVAGKWVGKLTQGPGGYTNLYDIELDLIQKKNVWGSSIATYRDSIDVRIGFTGYFNKNDTLFLSEDKKLVIKDVVPPEWYACVKNFYLGYRKEGKIEYLEGRWDGVRLEKPNENVSLKADSNAGYYNNPDICVPGRILLSRRIEDVNDYIFANRDTVILSEQIVDEPTPEPIDFSAPFLNTSVHNITTIEVDNIDLKLQLLDYQKVDNDTVSIYFNRKPLSRNIRVSKKPVIINFRIDPRMPLNELLLYAENLGYVPPNTSELIVIDGKKTHLVHIVSDKQKTAAVYLKYKAPK